jgi:hypothetical protein
MSVPDKDLPKTLHFCSELLHIPRQMVEFLGFFLFLSERLDHTDTGYYILKGAVKFITLHPLKMESSVYILSKSS